MIDNKEKNFVSAVVYVRNDEAYIQQFLRELNQTLEKKFEQYEIICVNDACDDRSALLIKEFAKSVKSAAISVINMSFYQGVELSMDAGLDLAIGDFVFEFDRAYMDYEADTIMKVYERSLEGYDIVAAAPDKMEQYTSRMFYFLFNRFSSSRYALRTESFRILSRRVINRVRSMSKTIPYRKAIYANCGLKMDAISYRNERESQMKLDDSAASKRRDVAIDSLVLFTDVAYKFAFSMTVIMMLISAFTAGYTVVVFVRNQPVAGWTTTMLVLSICFLGVFATLAVIIKYLAILVDLVFKKKSYITESIEKLTK